MRIDSNLNNYKIIAPQFRRCENSESDILGMMIWLWLHSGSHRKMQLYLLENLLLPVIKNRQFVLICDTSTPVFYMSWANFNVEAEQRFLENHPWDIPKDDWNCGDRMWIIDWVAPFGHTMVVKAWLYRDLLANFCARTLYHRGNETGRKILKFRGVAVSLEEEKMWWAAHPLINYDKMKKQ